MRNTINILNVLIDNVTMKEAINKILFFLCSKEDKVHTIYTPNAEIIMTAKRDIELKNILNDASLLIADGAGVVIASKILSTPLPERVAGFDLISNLFNTSSNKNSNNKLKYFLFGGKPGIAEKAASNILIKYNYVEIVGCLHGYYEKENKDEDKNNIIEIINSSGADILLVALGAPKQEKWIHKNKNFLKTKICIGVGGSFDIFASVSTRAPRFFCENNLEWLYRLYKEPWRFIRMLDLPKFIFFIILKKLFKRII